MALIVDPDLLVDATEIVVDTTGKTVQLLVAGNLSTDGVTLKCVYSKLKDLWKNSATYIKYPFPMQPITDEQMELINGWDWEDDVTRYLLRSGGWALKDGSGVSQEEWSGVITLGALVGGSQVYCQQSSGGSAVDFQLTGPVNQAIKVYGDLTHGDFDKRAYMKLFVRKQGNLFAGSQLSDIGVTGMTYQVYRFPLTNAADLKVTHTDVQIDANSDGTPDVAPYDAMTITWFAAPQQKSIGGTNRDFHVIVDANGGTLEQVYEFVQWSLRRATGDIDAGAGTKVGLITNELMGFVGDTLKCKSDSTGGVFIDDIQDVDKNRIVFMDDVPAERTYPYVAVLTLQFGANLVADANAVYRVYFTNDDAGSNLGYDFGTADAITVDDADAADMAGSVSAQASIQHSFAYDANVQRGSGSDGDDAPITVVAIGLSSAQYVKATGTIQRSTANVISLVSPLERNYSNPS